MQSPGAGIAESLALPESCSLKQWATMNVLSISIWGLQESNSLPPPKVEGDDLAQGHAFPTIYSHPVVSLYCNLCFHFFHEYFFPGTT